ncbi:MAG: AI-2E family transporter [Parvibaculum sp.]|nr:AI-2E family transporter [Parvibaculum sp.]
MTSALPNEPEEVVQPESPAPVQQRTVIQLPEDMKVVTLVGIFGLLLLFALYFTKAIVMPIVFAFILYLMLQPGMRVFARLHIPKFIGALVIVSMLFGSLGTLGYTLVDPATSWIAKAPESISRLEQRLSSVKKSVANVQQATSKVEKIAAGPASGVREVTVAGPNLSSFLFDGTMALIVGGLTTLVLLYFLLVSGDLFLRRLVEIMPTLKNKKQAVDIAREIENNISGYLVTISLMNLAVGVATGIAAYLCGLSDPILWGAMAFLLNYIPILGPLFGVAIIFFVGMLTFPTIWQAFVPAGIYLVIHFVESETVTPILLARRFALNPVLIIVAIVFWYWMWGTAGALLAVPMLAACKIICDRVGPLMALGHFLGSDARS